MSAFAYIEASDVPRPLMDNAARRTADGDKLIAFIGCPVTGIEQDDGEIQFPFPRRPEIHDPLISWLCHWGLSFRVEM
ncbi:hypothetical protein [Caballeronia sp. LZ043]|uniref:hypothetical protein n=1 Tax=Caballeronia sp. LZ043 TaxID=3038569 RepID=UPI0028586BED|nr:hypothetical protein [Caballeronia sp. LZ043]MDR5825809.1 hypothetical protein [Caballeronia sp. LZ043]